MLDSVFDAPFKLAEKERAKTMRIEGVSKDKAGLFVRLSYWFSQRRFGKVADPFRVMGHHSWVSFGAGMFELASERSHLVESRLKDLAQIKAATLVGCPF